MNVTGLNDIFSMKDNRYLFMTKIIEKILGTEDVTAMFHDFQEPICMLFCYLISSIEMPRF